MKFEYVILGFTILALASVGIGFCWYQASVQAAVYRRQGVEMTTWECFIGAKPAERTVNLRRESE